MVPGKSAELQSMVSNQKYISGTNWSRQVIKVGRMDLEGVDREVGMIKNI